jgi:hypothetical protein
VVDSILKKLSIFIPILLTIVLAFSMIPNAFAGTWIFYDDGGAESQIKVAPGYYMAVKFTNPLPRCKILTARYYIYSDPVEFNLHIFNSDGSIRLFGPLSVNPISTGWFDVDLIPYNIEVTGDFMVAIQWVVPNDPEIGNDEDNAGHSYYKTSGDWIFSDRYAYMIRAEIDSIHAVGGIYAPMNKLNILTPFIALVGLIGAISTIFAIRRWRKN